MKSKSKNTSHYTRSKDAYDGNMELTNLKSSNQKTSGSGEPLPESARPRKDGPGGE